MLNLLSPPNDVTQILLTIIAFVEVALYRMNLNDLINEFFGMRELSILKSQTH
jgi:hypothetical protein